MLTLTDINAGSVNKTPGKSVSVLGCLVFFAGLMFYAFNYLLRVYPNVMEPQLFSHFGISATGFGLLASFYYFAYAPMQLPVGVSVDKIGPRRSLIAACSICLLGVYIFSATDIYAFAIVGRFLIGMGTAFAYVTALKLATIWFPKRYFATAAGGVTAFGMLGGVFTEKFATFLINTYGYHYTVRFPLYVGAVVLLLIVLLVKDKPETSSLEKNDEESHALSYAQLAQYLKVIAKSKQMWLIGLLGALLYLPSTVFCDLWGVSYLEHVYRLTPQQAATGVSILLLGWLISSLSTGFLSDMLKMRKSLLVFATGFSCLFSAIILYVPGIDTTMLYGLLFFWGLSCGPHPLTFTMSKENNPQKIAGTAVSFANLIIMGGGFIFQPLVGKFLDLGWSGTMAYGVRVYSVHNFTVSLSILPIGLLIAFILSLNLKETYGN